MWCSYRVLTFRCRHNLTWMLVTSLGVIGLVDGLAGSVSDQSATPAATITVEAISPDDRSWLWQGEPEPVVPKSQPIVSVTIGGRGVWVGNIRVEKLQ